MYPLNFTPRLKLPCKDCTKRELGCHSTCKEYIYAKAEYSERKEKIREQESLYNYIGESINRCKKS